MKPQVEITIHCSSSEARQKLSGVLAPDNEGGPRGLGISMKGEGAILRISISSETPSTAVSTALAFLNDASLFQEVWLLSRTKDAHDRGAETQ